MNMKTRFIVVLLLLLPLLRAETPEHKKYELPRSQVVPMHDTESGREYELYVKLPQGYLEKSEATYPVIYFTDAVWSIELLSASTEYLMEDVILVGISWQKNIDEALKKDRGAHVSRFRDYSIKKSSNPERQAKYQFGQASHHLAFIRNNVIKYVESNYRTDPDMRTYFGYSLGGLFGAYILLSQPDTFKNYILGSPSLWSFSEFEPEAALKGKSLNANVFISNGALENKLSKHIKEFVTFMENRGDKSLSLKHVVIEGNHQTAAPMTGVRGVTWLSNL